jgi:hypothetical protein
VAQQLILQGIQVSSGDVVRGGLQRHGLLTPHERLHRTLLDNPFREGRRTGFETIEEMQVSLDSYLKTYNESQPPQGRGSKGRTPSQAFHREDDRHPAGRRLSPTTDAALSCEYNLCTIGDTKRSQRASSALFVSPPLSIGSSANKT